MRTLREHLRIAFGLIQPEVLIMNMRSGGKDCALKLDSTEIGLLTYRHFSSDLLKTLTYEEVDILYDNMKEMLGSRGKTCGGASVFALIPEYTLRVLKLDGGEPVCRQEQMLNWRYCYLFLGQDFLAAAHLAYINGCEYRTVPDFTWPAQINSDERRLCNLLRNGLAENHFHLGGSSRTFDLSWICLMNHPDHIIEYFDKPKKRTSEKAINDLFDENLNMGVSLGISDNRFSWSKRLSIACWLRIKLFEWLKGGDISAAFQNSYDAKEELFDFIDNSYSSRDLKNIVEAARFLYGGSRKICQPDRRNKCVDYAITYDVLKPGDINNCCRSLVGERAFLYKALYQIYFGDFSDKRQRKCFMDMFYLYILIKIQFRNELIQMNGKYGFKNFAKYQDRKDLIFEKFTEYELEAKNLSVNESMKNGCLSSLEMRIIPRKRYDEQEKKILQTDISLLFLRTLRTPPKSAVRQELKKNGLNESYFYVLHFPKIPESPKKGNNSIEPWLVKCRNYNLRKTTKIQTFAIAKAIDEFDWLCTRIRGFDACTFEIGCRPELFSTEFRFLRDFFRTKQSYFFEFKGALQPKLCATYHVGEDFMDIVDGLRAIDEAITFLELEAGERLGHAMALGVDPRSYYSLKHNRIILCKQDHLDNLVWILNKSQKYGINIDSNFKQESRDTAERLLFEIYGPGYTLMDYYNSWQLRGDDPELYRFGIFDEDGYSSKLLYKLNNIGVQYNKHRIMRHYRMDSMRNIRENRQAAKLYSIYHFDHSIREKGRKTVEIKVSEKYIETVYALQNKMMQEIAQLRLCIETNPSSNVLIGPFDRYEKHPIFRFYPVHSSSDEIVQMVSVNTDDQGVFDTSLAMEYSLLACAMRKMKDENYNIKYNEDVIFDYLERLRRNGFSMIFPKIQGQDNTTRNSDEVTFDFLERLRQGKV